MLILPAEADEALVGTAVGRIEKVITTHGGAIGTIDRWGRRRFAFEIADQHEGYYVVVRFAADPSAQTELERALNLADEVIRHKVVLVPQKHPQQQQREVRKPDANVQATSPAPAGTTV